MTVLSTKLNALPLICPVNRRNYCLDFRANYWSTCAPSLSIRFVTAQSDDCDHNTTQSFEMHRIHQEAMVGTHIRV